MHRSQQARERFEQGTVIPATPLVLDDQRQFNQAGQRRLIRYYLDAGVGGIATAVHTTQFAIREKGLFSQVLNCVAEEIQHFEQENKCAIFRIAGACGPTPQAVKEAQIARQLGYDAVLLSPGGLAQYSEQQLLERTRAVGEVMPVIGFYLQPAVGGRMLSQAYWQAMCAMEQVIGIKCASFDRYSTMDVVRAAAMSGRGEALALYTGNDDNIIIDLLTKYEFVVNGEKVVRRFVGGLLGHWSVWTKRVVELFEEIRAAAQQPSVPAYLLTLAAQVTDCNSAVFDVANRFAGSIAGVHEVLRRQGLIEGIWCLDPQETLSPGQVEQIDRVVAMYPHLMDRG